LLPGSIKIVKGKKGFVVSISYLENSIIGYCSTPNWGGMGGDGRGGTFLQLLEYTSLSVKNPRHALSKINIRNKTDEAKKLSPRLKLGHGYSHA